MTPVSQKLKWFRHFPDPSGVADRNPLTRASTRFYWYISGVKSLGILERRLRGNPSALGEPRRPLLYDLLPLRQCALFLAPLFSHPEIYYTLLLATPRSSWHIYSECIIICAHAYIRVCVRECFNKYKCVPWYKWWKVPSNDWERGCFRPAVVTRYCHELSSLRENCLANRSR